MPVLNEALIVVDSFAAMRRAIGDADLIVPDGVSV